MSEYQPQLVHETLAAALVAALSELTVVERGRTANVGSYSYDYADLGDVVKLTRSRLAEHGLVALTPVHAYGDGLACTVHLVHSSGQTMEFPPFSFPHGRDAQATGSMVTYHRRYALVAALGMAAGDDDDGAKAEPRQQSYEDPAVPGLRSSIIGAIDKLDDAAKAALKDWMRDEDLPPVRRMNASQCDRVIEHLMSLSLSVTPVADSDAVGESVPVENRDDRGAQASASSAASGRVADSPTAQTQGAEK